MIFSPCGTSAAIIYSILLMFVFPYRMLLCLSMTIFVIFSLMLRPLFCDSFSGTTEFQLEVKTPIKLPLNVTLISIRSTAHKHFPSCVTPHFWISWRSLLVILSYNMFLNFSSCKLLDCTFATAFPIPLPLFLIFSHISIHNSTNWFWVSCIFMSFFIFHSYAFIPSVFVLQRPNLSSWGVKPEVKT